MDTEQNEAFFRKWTIPEEDRAKYTTQPWAGEYRWFRSPKCVLGALPARATAYWFGRPSQSIIIHIRAAITRRLGRDPALEG
jgi:hypothetical protein